jgi:hypothetical protein
MAAPTTSTTAATQTADCQAGDKSVSRPVEVEIIEIEEDQQAQIEQAQPNQAAEQHQTTGQSQSTDDDQEDDSFFGKPDSAKRLYWYIGGIIVVMSTVALYYYLQELLAQKATDIDRHDHGFAEDNEQAHGQEPAAWTNNQPTMGPMRPRPAMGERPRPAMGERPRPAYFQRPTNNPLELTFRSDQGGRPLNQQQIEELRQRMEAIATRYMQQPQTQRPTANLYGTDFGRIRENPDVTQDNAFGVGAHHYQQTEYVDRQSATH